MSLKASHDECLRNRSLDISRYYLDICRFKVSLASKGGLQGNDQFCRKPKYSFRSMDTKWSPFGHQHQKQRFLDNKGRGHFRWLARPRGFEPLTSASGGLRSIQLS